MNIFPKTHIPVLIIGGGIQGVLLANGLREYSKLRESIWILDPKPNLLEYWIQDTSQSKVQFLRSSISHSISPEFHSLRRFAMERGLKNSLSEDDFIHLTYDQRVEFDLLGTYMRPSLRLFNNHARWFIKEHGLEDFHVQGTCMKIVPVEHHGYKITYIQNEVYHQVFAQSIICAYGQPRTQEQLIPSILSTLPNDITSSQINDKEVHILGGGLSGSQFALWALDSGASKVIIYDIDKPTFSRFDFDPCYIGPKCNIRFGLLESPIEKIDLSLDNRYPGTMPSEIYRSIINRLATPKLEWITTNKLMDYQEFIEISSKALSIDATGFRYQKPNLGPWIQTLPTHRGYPLLDRKFQWAPNLFVIGSHGLAAAGPAAGNIIGAHLAKRAIVPMISSMLT
jgi:hypothetical protein